MEGVKKNWTCNNWQHKEIIQTLVNILKLKVQDEELKTLLKDNGLDYSSLEGEIKFVHRSRFKRKYEDETPKELNSEGKTPISFLQEFSRSKFRASPEYRVTIQDDATKPFVCTVYIKNKEYGKGSFSNKKQAKHLAAESAIQLLCPEHASKLQNNISDIVYSTLTLNEINLEIPITSNLILNYLSVNGIKTPLQLLQEYCAKQHITLEFKSELLIGDDKSEQFKVIGNIKDVITKETISTTKQEAKQIIAQQMLSFFHPTIDTYKNLLDIYTFHSSTNHFNYIHKNDINTNNSSNNNNNNNNNSFINNDNDTDETNIALLTQLKEAMKENLNIKPIIENHVPCFMLHKDV